MIDAGDAVLIEADTQLGTKLNSFILLAPDDRANMGLMDTNDPVIATSGEEVATLARSRFSSTRQ